MKQTQAHVMIVEARYYEALADELAKGAIAEIEGRGATYQRVAVPGVLELPTAVKFCLDSMAHGGSTKRIDGFVILGCVIRGETTHYDIVANESARALMNLVVERSLALGNGIQTVENEAQAWARAKVDEKNKGGAAASACLDMIDLKRSLGA
ncbi:MAG: 6,7-dimethyl-8-ribityllumazine synthase [Rhizobiales bacterium]|nr:6,7-dimethyl-8-ribityllumazine synthase [Hyphomicrobiales bacterium]